MSNSQLVTTGLIPLVIGSAKKFVANAPLDGLFWDLTGGGGSLLLADPTGAITTIPVTVAGGVASATWLVVGPAGDWRRAWSLRDASGLPQVSEPIAFTVISSPV